MTFSEYKAGVMRRARRALVIGALFGGTAGCESEWVLSKLMEENTEYATGYSEDGFRRIEEGMTFDEVRAILGPPLFEYDFLKEPSAVGWRYSHSPKDRSYRVRSIVLHQGRVSDVHREFYVD